MSADWSKAIRMLDEGVPKQEVAEAIAERAKEEGRTMADVMNQAIRLYWG